MLPTVDRNGQPGHPTRRFDMVRKLHRRGKARIIGGGASGKPPVVQLLHKDFDPSEMTVRRFIIVLDPGYRHIGFAVCEIIGSKLIVYAVGTLRTRIPSIKKQMDERRRYRRFKRFVAESVLSGKYLYSPMLKDVLGKNYVHPDTCRCIIQNEGIVIK